MGKKSFKKMCKRRWKHMVDVIKWKRTELAFKCLEFGSEENKYLEQNADGTDQGIDLDTRNQNELDSKCLEFRSEENKDLKQNIDDTDQGLNLDHCINDVWHTLEVKEDTLCVSPAEDAAKDEWLSDQKDDDKVFEESQSEEWVIEQQLCRCCHAEGDNFLSLHDMDQLEGVSYEEMLATCSGVLWVCVEAGELRALCGLCAARLRNAHSFGRQMRACEERFRTLYNSNLVRVTDAASEHVELKEEPIDTLEDFGHSDASENLLEDESMQKVPKKEAHTDKEHKKLCTTKGTGKEKPKNSRRASYKYCKKAGRKYECLRCKSQYTSRSSCKQHYDRVHLNLKIKKEPKIKKKQKIRCKRCCETFNTRDDLAEHTLKCNVLPKYQCNACDKFYSHPSKLVSHKQSYHMLGEKLSCEMCDYESYCKSSLQKHMEKHKTVKEFHCKYCEKSFLRQKTLVYHERIHTGDKRKKCQECGQAFVQKASLNYHMAKYHPEVRF